MSAKKAKNVDFSAYGEDQLGSSKATLDKMSGMKQNHKERLGERADAKKAVQRAAFQKQEKASWKKKIGGAFALFFLCGVGLFQFFMAIYDFARGTGISNVDIKDTAKVKSILFSGDPWFVYCVNNQTVYQKLPQVLTEGAHDWWSNLGVQSAVLDCWEPTESGRSVADRFKFNKKPPLSFVVANGNKPRVLQLEGASKPEDIEKRLKPALKLSVPKIDTLKKWPSLCTGRKSCIVIGHKNTAQRDYAQGFFDQSVLEKHRAARIVTLDTSFWQLKLGDAVMKTRASKEGKKGKSADVICLSRDEGKKGKGNGTHSGTFLQELDATVVDVFMQACQSREGLVQIEVPPKINARPSKPKKVKAPPPPSPRPPPPPVKQKGPKKVKQDHVGSRESLESEEPLFEAVEEEDSDGEEGSDNEEGGQEEQEEEEDEEEQPEESDGDDDGDEDEVEL